VSVLVAKWSKLWNRVFSNVTLSKNISDNERVNKSLILAFIGYSVVIFLSLMLSCELLAAIFCLHLEYNINY